VKPKSSSRGRGIFVTDDAGAVPLNDKTLAQRYINKPHLYEGHKYVFRFYLLITSVDPLRVYLYKDGFVKLASEPCAGNGVDNLYAHLTNPDINALNANVEKPVVFYRFNAYRDWLRDQGADPAPIFDGIRKIGILIAIAARETMRNRIKESKAFGPGCYELIGMDCMVDEDLKPWLLECNLSPSLAVHAGVDSGGDIETDIKQSLVRDLVGMLALNNPNTKPTLEDDLSSMAHRAAQEMERAGNYERIFPAKDAAQFAPYFPAPRYRDVALAEAAQPLDALRYQIGAADELAVGDELALVSRLTSKAQTPTTEGAYIWLRATRGDAPSDIVADLAGFAQSDTNTNASHPQHEQIRQAVWETLADWGQDGLIAPADATTDAAPNASDIAEENKPTMLGLVDTPGKAVALQCSAPPVAARLRTLITHSEDNVDTTATQLTILNGPAGYAISDGATLISTEHRLNEIADRTRQFILLENAHHCGTNVMVNASIWRFHDVTVLITSNKQGLWDGLGAQWTLQKDCGTLLGGAAVLTEQAGEATPIALPARVRRSDVLNDDQHNRHAWPGETEGAFIKVSASGNSSQKIDCVILPVHDQSIETAKISPLIERQAFTTLMNARVATSATEAPSQAARIADWLAGAPIVEVRFADITNGAAAITAHLQKVAK